MVFLIIKSLSYVLSVLKTQAYILATIARWHNILVPARAKPG